MSVGTMGRLVHARTKTAHAVRMAISQAKAGWRVLRSVLKAGWRVLRSVRNVIKLFTKRWWTERDKGEVLGLRKRIHLGFVARGMEELILGANDATRPKRQRLAARELAVWRLNQAGEDSARQGLKYLAVACEGRIDPLTHIRATVLEAEAHSRLGNTTKAREILSEELRRRQHPDLLLARANLEADLDRRLHWINCVYEQFGVQQIELRSDPAASPYDRLSAKKNPQPATIAEQPLVSVIMPAYNAEPVIRTAIESILAQSWRMLELLVVDDFSTDNTVSVVEEYCKKDPRVRLIRSKENNGPYVARNLGLKESRGELITCNDGDDWSHPQKIETQAIHLLRKGAVMANTSTQARVFEDLTFHRRGNPGFYIQFNMSSLMFRRQVVETVGFWDSVRFAGDSEYLRRIKKVFGVDAVMHLETAPLSLQRQTHDSLTGSLAFGYHGFKMGARREYDESVKCYHDSHERPYIDFPLSQRPFPVPEPMLPRRKMRAGERRKFDVVMVSDFRLPGGSSMSNAEEIKAHSRQGLRTGLVQMSRYDVNSKRPKNPKIAKLIDGDLVERIVYGERIACDSLILRLPWILQDWQEYIPDVEAKNIRVIVNQPPKRSYGANGTSIYHIPRCVEHLKRYFGESGVWHPIGPLVREALINHHADELSAVRLSDEDWSNIIDVEEWRSLARPPRGGAPRIGRHARDHPLKWPATKQDLLRIYPDDAKYRVQILGGAGAARSLLGRIPSNWQVLKFDEIDPREYLAELDVFVYYTHPDWVESFGRVIIEAMAAGVPVIVPPTYERLFQHAALYAEPKDVLPLVDKLMDDPDYYHRQTEIALDFVRRNFSYERHIERLKKIIAGAHF